MHLDAALTGATGEQEVPVEGRRLQVRVKQLAAGLDTASKTVDKASGLILPIDKHR